MHRVGSAGNTTGSTRPRKEKRFTYVLNDADDKKHCAGINCLSYLNGSASGTSDYIFSGSRDGTLKRWELNDGDASFSATFESHVDWVNDSIVVGQKLVSCSSDTTLKVWNCFSDGACTRTLRQHSDYVICLAAAEKNSNIVASGGLGGEVFIWDLDAALTPVAKSVDAKEDELPNGNSGSALTTLCNVSSNITSNGQSHAYSPITAKGHKDSVYALAMNDTGTLLVSGGTEKVLSIRIIRFDDKVIQISEVPSIYLSSALASTSKTVLDVMWLEISGVSCFSKFGRLQALLHLLMSIVVAEINPYT
ncbi:hypothetical protein PR202_ga03929 [Eleusine coracana subsp. coracana]|uniref:Uncharacterized protein n=1 Tax=Eleusine coracana subsp. coracana TaxID=191504 RepID=A0AAV5BQM2_ELECO|nr:hypothetical protein PR202_ga03929 [Eleusine coracana subsp. coracana]